MTIGLLAQLAVLITPLISVVQTVVVCWGIRDMVRANDEWVAAEVASRPARCGGLAIAGQESLRFRFVRGHAVYSMWAGGQGCWTAGLKRIDGGASFLVEEVRHDVDPLAMSHWGV